MSKYYEVLADMDGETEVMFGSFLKSEAQYELEAERDNWKADGYKKLRIKSRLTDQVPDPEVYGDDAYKKAVCVALKDKDVTVNVCDMSEDHDDLEDSRNVSDIFEACEATDSPVVKFHKDGTFLGCMWVMVGYGDESISDHVCNEFMNSIVG